MKSNLFKARAFALSLLLGLPPGALAGQATEWKIVEGVLKTRFAASVSPTNAHLEHPRPQMVRPDWRTLNGLWNYAITGRQNAPPTNYQGGILVPFPVESALSGVGRRLFETNLLWCQRTFNVPAEWAGRQILLHFGAVDWEARVFVNGREAGRHRGGFDPFTLNITSLLLPQGEQQVTVAVFDPTEGEQPRGKQSRNPEGIFYTPSSGIWQTVWLEPVSPARIDALRMTPSKGNQAVRLIASCNRIGRRFRVEAEAFAEGKCVGRAVGLVNAELELRVENPRPWSPEDPFLYDLQVRLFEEEEMVDHVTSYFALRTVELSKDASGTTRILLNGKPRFFVGVLDQGFWPDGLYTAPSDAAWREELTLIKQMGFNTVRKHVKVEPERWYYWCDRLGLCVWQDMPSGNNFTETARRQFEMEMERMFRNLHNHPSILMWVLFNEAWGQYDTERLTARARQMDDSRLINSASGWVDYHVGDIADAHIYPGPDLPPGEVQRAAVLGEFGGLGLAIEAHLWSDKTWGYETAQTPRQLATRYTQLFKRIWNQWDTSALAGAIYTQLSDVETECNGLLTYDRAVVKLDPAVIHGITSGEDRDPPFRVLSPTADSSPVYWFYTNRQPRPRWNLAGFRLANGWSRGRAGFGSVNGEPGFEALTQWAEPEIWLRRQFILRNEDSGEAVLRVAYRGKAQIFINGEAAAQVIGRSEGYERIPIDPQADRTLHEGLNALAVHAQAGEDGSYIDVGLEMKGTEGSTNR